MIVFEDRQLVIITPPHVASGNLHRACCDQLGAKWAIGVTPDGKGYDHHVTQIAEGWRDFGVALVVRHPLDRLIGLYEHHQQASRRHGWQPIEWWMFVAMVLENHPDLSWFYRTTISALIGDTQIDAVVRYESLSEDLAELLCENVLLAPGWVDQRHWPSFFRQGGVCAMAEWWGRDDMQRFGYVTRLT